MIFEIQIHPRVIKYLDRLSKIEKNQCDKNIEKLSEDPFHTHSSRDIKKLHGDKKDLYRLRVGNNRIEYFIENNSVWLTKTFKRERGYK